jgi:hypothetical protein
MIGGSGGIGGGVTGVLVGGVETDPGKTDGPAGGACGGFFVEQAVRLAVRAIATTLKRIRFIGSSVKKSYFDPGARGDGDQLG